MDAFKVELARIAYSHKIFKTDPRGHLLTAIQPRSIEQIKAQMKSEGYGNDAIEMFYMQAEKQFLNIS